MRELGRNAALSHRRSHNAGSSENEWRGAQSWENRLRRLADFGAGFRHEIPDLMGWTATAPGISVP